MEGWVVGPINGVFSVNVTNDEEGIVVGLFQDWDLMRRGVSTQTQISIEVVSVCGLPANMVFRDVECIETVFRRHSRVKVIEELEFFAWHTNLREAMSLWIEEIKGLVNQRSQWVLWILNELALG